MTEWEVKVNTGKSVLCNCAHFDVTIFLVQKLVIYVQHGRLSKGRKGTFPFSRMLEYNIPGDHMVFQWRKV